MKKLMLFAVFALSVTAFADGRALVEKVEADKNVSALVNNLIKHKELRCERPNLGSLEGQSSSLDFSVVYLCSSGSSTAADSSITITGNVIDSEVLVIGFNYEVFSTY